MKYILKSLVLTNYVIGFCLIAVPIVFLVSINTPEIWYQLNPNALTDELNSLTREPFNPGLVYTPDNSDKEFVTALAPDTSIPKGTFLKIPSIGIDTTIYQGENPEEALDKGVWQMPGYGTPEHNDQPLILAAHRWGRSTLSSEFRNQNLFINLPDLKEGDPIEIIWNQASYKYKIVQRSESTYISRLSDLILITCKFFNSPDRILIYAERV